MKVIKGDLITLAEEGVFDVIIHGANCQCTMNSGIAKQIRTRHPLAYKADQETKVDVMTHLKLGGFSQSMTCGANDSPFYIINAYTQDRYGTDRRHVSYDAVRQVFRLIAIHYEGFRIGYPRIGAGLGGGDWEIISKIIDKELAGLDHTLVEYEGTLV